MSNVLRFPSDEERLWSRLRNTVSEQASRAGASEDKINEFCLNFKPIFKKFMVSHEFNVDLQNHFDAEKVKEEVERLAHTYTDHITSLLFDRLVLEMELFNW